MLKEISIFKQRAVACLRIMHAYLVNQARLFENVDFQEGGEGGDSADGSPWGIPHGGPGPGTRDPGPRTEDPGPRTDVTSRPM